LNKKQHIWPDVDKQTLDILRPFVAASEKIGCDPMLIQGGGGNTSVKVDDVLWVKASGYMLKDAVVEWMFVPLNLTALRSDVASGGGSDVAQHIIGRETLRPSIETTLHALLDHRVVLHVHSVNALSRVVRRDGQALVSSLLEGLRWSWIDYKRPGLPLTRATQAAIVDKPDVLVLQNHGLVVGGENVQAAEALLRKVEERLVTIPRHLVSADKSKLTPFLGAGTFRLPRHDSIHALATDEVCLSAAKGGVPYPDHVVFLAPEPCVVSSYEHYQREFDQNPKVVLVEGVGVVVRQDISFAAEEMLLCQAETFLRVPEGVEIDFLSEGDVAELLDWDAEKYRRSLTI
jgi:rhamnose utilization protein RhaD (predicted bifunctional aldolase and dehydrogenase)